MKKPLVSVILPVYNNAPYLREAIQCILDQTYDNFEFIIINDGSKDNSAEIIESFDDPRIRFYNQANIGLANTLNRGISLAQGEYIARQDGDDISFPQRFEKQVKFLEENPDYALVGTWSVIVEENTETKRFHKHPANSPLLKFQLLFDNPFVHSSVMVRKSIFEKVGLYCSEKDRQPEDYELWSRVAREYEVSNLPEVLHKYREVAGSMCRTGENPYQERLVNLSAENIALSLGRDKKEQPIVDLAALTHRAYHKVSTNPAFSEMSGLLQEAASRIAKTPEEKRILREEANWRFRKARINYLKNKLGPVNGKILGVLEGVSKGEIKLNRFFGKP